MVLGLGKTPLSIGSDQRCDVILSATGVAAFHAELHLKSDGAFVFVNGTAGQSTAGGRSLAAGEEAPFDFRNIFKAGDAVVPFDHPAIAKSLLAWGPGGPCAERVRWSGGCRSWSVIR